MRYISPEEEKQIQDRFKALLKMNWLEKIRMKVFIKWTDIKEKIRVKVNE